MPACTAFFETLEGKKENKTPKPHKQEHYAFLSACLEKQSDTLYFHFASVKVKYMLQGEKRNREQIFP